MQRFLVGNLFPFGDINLESAPPAKSVDGANALFTRRTAAAVMLAANNGLPDSANGQEEDYGSRVLAKMAYSDYFRGPDQVPGRASAKTLRAEANESIAIQVPGNVGSSVNRTFIQHFVIVGEYDVALTAYVKLYYRFYDALSEGARRNLFDTLLSQRGKYNAAERLVAPFQIAGVEIPETENHRLMIQSAKYLTNQLYFQASVAAGTPDHANFDNNRNGDGGSNPSMVDVILDMLRRFLIADFIEYNARPYQDYTMSALLNLVSFAYDDRVRLAARMVLDYVSAKVAVSSQDLRRCPPYRRLNKATNFGPAMPNGFLGSPLVYNFGDTPFEPDPQIGFYTLLAGNTGVFASPPAQTPPPIPGHAPANYAFEMVHAGLSDYRIPPAILDLFVNPASRTFHQGFQRDEGNLSIPAPIRELYAGSPSYLITAGGSPSFFAYRADILGIAHPGEDADLGIAMPTTFIPSVDCNPRPPGFGTMLSDVIQFGKATTDLAAFNLGVAPNFACGSPVYVPDVFEPHAGDPTVVGDGNWTFVNRGSGSSGPGYYLAIFRVNDSPGAQNRGVLEAYDTFLNSFAPEPGGSAGLTFEEFRRSVKANNASLVLRAGNFEISTYTTHSGQRIDFTLAPVTGIVSTTAEPDQSIFRRTFAHGSVVNSGQVSGQDLTQRPVGTGLITISNPAVGTITLDMRAGAAAGDPLFGLHHPSRTSESGKVETAGSNDEVWVDSNYPGAAPSAGDFGDPFRTLGEAMDRVKPGGTVRIVNVRTSESQPVAYTRRLTLRAAGAAVILPR